MATPSSKKGWKMSSIYMYLRCVEKSQKSLKKDFILMKSLGFPSEDVPNRQLDVEM